MRRKYIILIISTIFLYIIAFIFFSKYYSNVKSDFLWRIPGFSYFDKVFQKIPTQIFYFNPGYLNKEKTDFIVVFSENDQKINDSLVNIAIKNIEFSDDQKIYRQANAIFENKKFKIKYKIHGTSVTSYLNHKRLSYSIKSTNRIFNKKKFKLIISYEMDYKNIFLNYISNDFGLISEDSGRIVSVNIGNKINDYFMYEDFNESFIEKKYDFVDPLVVRNLTFHNEVNSHSSEIDEYSYDLDLINMPYDYFLRWDKLKSLNYQNYLNEEKSVYGKFLAFLYFFGNPHQITGNNDKWIITKKYILPVYRNEGFIKEYNYGLNSNFDNQIFEEYFSSNTHKIYKNHVIDNDIRHERNKALFELFKNENKIIQDFDSIYYANIDKHKRYNTDYFKIKNNHFNYKKIISKNIKNIGRHIKTGKVIALSINDTLKISMESYMKMEIIVNKEKYDYDPVKLQIINNKIIPKREEFKIYFGDEIKKIQVINRVTNDTLKMSIDFKLLKIIK